MPNISNNIGTSKTIRDFINTYKNSHSISITYPGTTELLNVYNVDVIWDGGNYYIAYTASEDGTDINIIALDSVLPIKLSKISTSASSN